jgi:PAS domain S-box-containing protein
VYPQGRSQVFFLAADITERRRIEEELRLSEERFRRALKNTPVSLAAMDKDLRYVWAYNQRTASPEDVVGKTVYDLFPAEAPYLESLQQRVVQTGTDVHEGIWVTRPQGRIFLDLHMEPMRDAAGGIIGIWITSVDLTAQKLAEQTLQTQADLLAKVQDPMVGTDEDLVINYWNQAAERTYGWKAAEVVGRPVTEVLGAHVPGPYRDEAIEQLLSAGSFRDESVVVRKNGAQIWVEAQTSLLGRPDGTMSGTISAQRDVSERKRAEEELRKSGERSRLFLTVADAVAEWTDLDKVLDASLEAIVGATAHSRASIGLWDPKSRRIQVMASAGAQPMGPASAPLEAFSHSMREAISTGKTVLVDYDRLPPEERQIADSYRTHDALLVPLVYHAQVTGVVLVDDPGEKSSFSDEERDLIEGIASQAAVAIENARLYEAQRNIAEQLQLAILDMPRSVSGLEFAHLYRSATEEAIVGGDFYDVFERNDGSIILLAGDVSGHGVNAARVATMVKASLVAFAQGGDPPGKVLINANQLLMRKRVPGFTSVLLATYDPSSGWLQYCSAGHPNLLVGHRDGTVEIVGTNHSPLGVFPEWSCSVDAVQVLPGDTLLLYTDGLTEARLDGRFFGEARLARVFGARLGTDLQRLPEALLDEALAFSGGRLQDDVAILAVRPVER